MLYQKLSMSHKTFYDSKMEVSGNEGSNRPTLTEFPSGVGEKEGGVWTVTRVPVTAV